MAADLHAKVQKLITLATTPGTPVEEARTAAMQVCLLIKGHGIQLGASTVDDPSLWSQVAVGVASCENCKDPEVAVRWADEIVKARKKRYG